MYHSVVTMTTVRYGDLVPGAVFMKLLACALVLEEICVLIGRLFFLSKYAISKAILVLND